jgi:2-amino-4-hydroxy-6-hydroxymethyldihydropteridine diphosphokinase
MIKTFLSLGTNLGNKEANLSATIAEIEENIGNISLSSGIYETEAWGFECESNFLNQVIMVETNLKPSQLINFCLNIEKKMGRERKSSGNYESRIIDIDILFYGDSIVNEDKLFIPHPLLQNRKFILKPLHEIAPDFIHPVLGKSISRLLEECTDTGEVRLVDNYK